MSIWDVSPRQSGLPNVPREDKFLPEERPADGTTGITNVQEDDISSTENIKKTVLKDGTITTYDENGIDQLVIGIQPDGSINVVLAKPDKSVRTDVYEL